MFVAMVTVIALYPISKQDITMVICTDNGDITNTYSADAINNMTELVVTCDSDITISEIKFYRLFRSVCVEKITSTEMYTYLDRVENQIIFNKKAIDTLKKLSLSFLSERLFLAEVLLALVIFLWILINAVGEKVDLQNRDNHGPIYEIKKFIKDMKNYWEYMLYAAKADLNAEVANSYLNRLWWILEPFCNMLVYVVVFGRIMGNSIDHYATFVFSALLMWNYFNRVVNYSVKCVRMNRDIVTKIYVPKYVLLITNMILSFIKLLFSLVVLIVMMLIFRVEIGFGAFWAISAYLLMLLISFSAGMIFMHYGVYIDDLAYAVGILLTMIMFLSGIFYDIVTTLSAPLNSVMMCLNPVAMFIDTMRNAIFYNSVTNVPYVIVWTILSLLIAYIGIHIVDKNENGYVKVI